MSRYVTQITITEWPTQSGVLLWEQPAPSEWRFSAQPKEALSGGDMAFPCREFFLGLVQAFFAAGTPLPQGMGQSQGGFFLRKTATLNFVP